MATEYIAEETSEQVVKECEAAAQRYLQSRSFDDLESFCLATRRAWMRIHTAYLFVGSCGEGIAERFDAAMQQVLDAAAGASFNSDEQTHLAHRFCESIADRARLLNILVQEGVEGVHDFIVAGSR